MGEAGNQGQQAQSAIYRELPLPVPQTQSVFHLHAQ
jgi:hypothetical protein